MMSEAFEFMEGAADSPFLLIADHASNHVPADVDLGISPELLNLHIAVDLGVRALAQRLCAMLNCPAISGGVSRLVIDYNREEEARHLIPTASDGHAIPGNQLDAAAKAGRLARFWRPYHQRIDQQIVEQKPRLLISLHSFTPSLSERPEEARPWEIGILYNEDDRAARIAIPLLEGHGAVVGDQLPYSGKLLNATMNRHGEAKGIAYLGIEMRQDEISDARGIELWAGRLVPVIRACEAGIAGA
jgi:predicted N-formylglutamate amidohydrolase